MTAHVSRNCDIGNHGRCLGTVLAFPPVDGERIVDCQCQAADCTHKSVAAATTSGATT